MKMLHPAEKNQLIQNIYTHNIGVSHEARGTVRETYSKGSSKEDGHSGAQFICKKFKVFKYLKKILITKIEFGREY